MKWESYPVVAGAVGKVEIPPLSRDFPAEEESPALGLFHGAAFSTALLPTNSAKEPLISHDVDDILAVAHRIVLLRKGRLIWDLARTEIDRQNLSLQMTMA